MVPKAKPVWQEPRMCLTNRLGLATISRYSTQILICFTAYIFPFSIPLVCWVGNLVFRDCLTVTTVHFDENRAVSKENQILQHPLHQLVKCCKTINPLVCIELMKLVDEVDKIYISGMFFCPRTKLIRLFYIGKWPLTKYIHSMLPMWLIFVITSTDSRNFLKFLVASHTTETRMLPPNRVL